MPDKILNCVVYLGARTDRGREYGGTAFYVSVPSPDVKSQYMYLVTAQHNLNEAVRHSRDGNILVRPNWSERGKTEPIETPRSQWVDHPDADVSILDIDVAGLRYASLDVGMVLSDELRQQEEIGVGDELQITGLFAGHRGTSKNVPIVRSGVIAAMPDPDEPVDTQLGPATAYLVEVRSLGGLSGSPVFVVLPPLRKKTAPAFEARSYLLGLVHGHWDRTTQDGEYVSAMEMEKINQGIAVVVPAVKILDLLNAPDEQARRRRAWDELTTS